MVRRIIKALRGIEDGTVSFAVWPGTFTAASAGDDDDGRAGCGDDVEVVVEVVEEFARGELATVDPVTDDDEDDNGGGNDEDDDKDGDDDEDDDGDDGDGSDVLVTAGDGRAR